MGRDGEQLCLQGPLQLWIRDQSAFPHNFMTWGHASPSVEEGAGDHQALTYANRVHKGPSALRCGPSGIAVLWLHALSPPPPPVTPTQRGAELAQTSLGHTVGSSVEADFGEDLLTAQQAAHDSPPGSLLTPSPHEFF